MEVAHGASAGWWLQHEQEAGKLALTATPHLSGGSRPCTVACRLRRHSPSWRLTRRT